MHSSMPPCTVGQAVGQLGKLLSFTQILFDIVIEDHLLHANLAKVEVNHGIFAPLVLKMLMFVKWVFGTEEHIVVVVDLLHDVPFPFFCFQH